MSVTTAGPVRPARARVAGGVLALVLLALAAVSFWYRAVYGVLPGQGAAGRVHWCGRDYDYAGAPALTWRQVSSAQRWPVRAVDVYPPLGWTRQQLFAAAYPRALRPAASCATAVYLRVGPQAYRAYSLSGGP